MIKKYNNYELTYDCRPINSAKAVTNLQLSVESPSLTYKHNEKWLERVMKIKSKNDLIAKLVQIIGHIHIDTCVA